MCRARRRGSGKPSKTLKEPCRNGLEQASSKALDSPSRRAKQIDEGYAPRLLANCLLQCSRTGSCGISRRDPANLNESWKLSTMRLLDSSMARSDNLKNPLVPPPLPPGRDREAATSVRVLAAGSLTRCLYCGATGRIYRSNKSWFENGGRSESVLAPHPGIHTPHTR